MKNIISSLKDNSSRVLHRKKTTIFFQGEVPRHALYILDGVVRAYSISNNGDECIEEFYTRGDILPPGWLNNHSTTCLFYYDAMTDVRALTISKDTFWRLLESKPTLLQEYTQYLSKEYTSLLLRINGLNQSRAIDKISYTLYYLLFLYGRCLQENSYMIDLRLSQTSLAQLIGQTRESTAKNIKILKNKGIINYRSSIYTVDKAKLEKFMGEDSFRDIDLT
jgi:CRP/FNR family transcriptional regulator